MCVGLSPGHPASGSSEKGLLWKIKLVIPPPMNSQSRNRCDTSDLHFKHTSEKNDTDWSRDLAPGQREGQLEFGLLMAQFMSTRSFVPESGVQVE